MLACIARSRHGGSLEGSIDEDDIPKSPATRETIRSLTNQLKGMAIKFSAGAYRHCKPCASADFQQEGHCIDSMDITDACSEVSSSNTHSLGPFFSTPPQSFQTPGRHASRSNSGYGTTSVNSRGSSCKVQEAERVGDSGSQNGFKSEYEGGTTEDESEKEWVAQVEPGVLITFVTLSDGRNDLKRIRFSREMFNKWQAQQWWAENCDKVHELFNVPKFSKLSGSLPTSLKSEELKDALGGVQNDNVQSSEGDRKQSSQRHHHHHHHSNEEQHPEHQHHHHDQHHGHNHPHRHHHHRRPRSMLNSDNRVTAMQESTSAVDARQELTARGDEGMSCSTSEWEGGEGRPAGNGEEGQEEEEDEGDASHGNMSCSNNNSSNEWVEEDEPGVYITLRSSLHGTRELKRVRFSREKFSEIQARLWWEENRVRIYEQYL